MSLPRPIRVVLIRPRNPKNIGAVARAMGNFGVTELVVLEPYEPVWRETVSAPSAEKIVLDARLASSWENAVGDALAIGTSSFHDRSREQATIELPNLAKFLQSFPASQPIALVFGSERSGLSNEELSRCRGVLHIPTQPSVPSMNLGQAVAVVLYEWRRGIWNDKPSTEIAAVSSQECDQLIDSLNALGETTDYPAGYDPAARLGRIRQALHPAVLPPATVRFWLSFNRWLLKKLAKAVVSE